MSRDGWHGMHSADWPVGKRDYAIHTGFQKRRDVESVTSRLSGMWKLVSCRYFFFFFFFFFSAGWKKASMLCEPSLSFCDDGQELQLHEIESEVKEPTAKHSRFASIRCEKVAKHYYRLSARTKKKTAKCLRNFQEYMQEKGIVCDLSRATAESLPALLEKMYLELRQQNGQPYSKSQTATTVTTQADSPWSPKSLITPINCGKCLPEPPIYFFLSKNVSKQSKLGSQLGCLSGRVQHFGTVHVISRFQAPRSRRTPVCISPEPHSGLGEICQYPPPTRGGTYTYC